MRTAAIVIEDLKKTIKARLDLCDASIMPYVCNMKSTPQGYNTIEQYVINLVCQADYGIIEALMEKEREINPQMIKD